MEAEEDEAPAGDIRKDVGEGFDGGRCQANGRPSPVIRSRCRSRIVFRISVLVAFAWHASLSWSFCAFALVELLAPLPCQFSECRAFPLGGARCLSACALL